LPALNLHCCLHRAAGLSVLAPAPLLRSWS
jgi:hypothetical protein